MNLSKIVNKNFETKGAKLWHEFKFKMDTYKKGSLKYKYKYGMKGDTLSKITGTLLKSRTGKFLDWYQDALDR